MILSKQKMIKDDLKDKNQELETRLAVVKVEFEEMKRKWNHWKKRIQNMVTRLMT